MRATAEIGVCKITQETSSAANVRRIEAVTGPAGVQLLRDHDRAAGRDGGGAADRARERGRGGGAAGRRAQGGARSSARGRRAPSSTPPRAEDIGGVARARRDGRDADPKALPALADRALRASSARRRWSCSAPRATARSRLVAAATPAAVERGVKAGALVKTAAAVVGGGGGGRDTMAQAGGRDPEKLPEALDAARAAIAAPSLELDRGAVLALDHGAARCGVAVSDPTGTLATPLEPVLRPDTRKGLARVRARDRRARRRCASSSACRCRLSGGDTDQTRAARAFAERLAATIDVPVELYDERFTTAIAARAGGTRRRGQPRRRGAARGAGCSGRSY